MRPVLASHVIFSVYGFWLPNDPRGSWSDFVAAWELFRYGGPATKVATHKSVARVPHDRQKRLAVKEQLKYPPVRFTGIQALAVASGFADFAAKNQIRIWACAIMPDHIHMVIARHHYHVEQIVTLLKGAATTRLNERGLHPMANFPKRKGRVPTCWARGEWKVFLDSVLGIRSAIGYVEDNPRREGLPPQNWPFVTPFEL